MKPFAFSFIALSWLFVGLVDAVPEPVVTPAPVVPRQFFTTDFGGDSFIGYFSTSGTYDAAYCDDGSTMFFGDQYAGCCPSDEDCILATSCKGNTVFGGGFETECPHPSSCNTDFILVKTGENTGWYWVGCATETEIVYFLTSPGEAAASTTLPAAASTTASPAAASSTASPNPSTSTASTSTQPSTTLPSTSHHKSANKAWIAGAVLGPLLLLALAGALAFFLLRRRRNKYNPYGKNPPPMPPPPLNDYPASPHPESVPLQQQQHHHQDAGTYGMGMVSHPGTVRGGYGPVSPQPEMLSPALSYATPGSPMAEGAVSPMLGHAEPAPPPYGEVVRPKY